MVSHKGSSLYTTQKTHKKLMGKLLVVGKRLNLRVKGPGEKPSRGKTRSSGTGDSHPWQESWSVSGDEAQIPFSLGTKGNQKGALQDGVQTRSDQVEPEITLE